jgi:hypothetical protein
MVDLGHMYDLFCELSLHLYVKLIGSTSLLKFFFFEKWFFIEIILKC